MLARPLVCAQMAHGSVFSNEYPVSRAEGDLPDLAQHLDVSLTFGRARRARGMVGMAPSQKVAPPNDRGGGSHDHPRPLRFAMDPMAAPGSPTGRMGRSARIR